MAEYTGSSFISPPVQAILDTKLTNPALDNLDLDMSNNNIIHCNNITFTLGGGGKIIFADDSSLNSAIGIGGGGGGTPALTANSVQFNNGGVFAGSSNFTYLDSPSSGTLTLNGGLDLSGSITFLGT
jgi:hypothetical protein